ncbi:6986_t:CDS:2 [Diversispora eburnea]|uniref:Anaphase-promoting complex subunit 10 n=1 Tax=Diversispora eburnea TaxID=1213867 RepID=A0A9N9BNZ2_9GLOM|nr:6986_t:CDS:2 [Diversispora eburnea]
MNNPNNVPDTEEAEEDMGGIVDDDENIFLGRKERKFIRSEFKHEELREIGSSAMWSLSSWKAGNGIENLRDNNQISLWLDYKSDESYTPNKITIRAGTNFGDLQDLRTIELEEPDGWIDIQLSGDHTLTYVSIKSNQQNGKDSHIRQIKVFAPKIPISCDDDSDDDIPFSSIEFTVHETIR